MGSSNLASQLMTTNGALYPQQLQLSQQALLKNQQGDIIKDGQVIGYVDQWGTSLPVKSDVEGEVLKLLFQDGDSFAKIHVSSFPGVPGGKGIGSDWRDRYLGIIDYSAIILWVMESAELAAVALSAGTTTAAGVGVGTVGALGAIALGATGPAAIAGLTAAAVGAAVVGGVAADKTMAKDAPQAANNLGEDYKVILQEEPFKSATDYGSGEQL